MSHLITTAVDAFNRHGSFTAQAVEHNLGVRLRHIDTGTEITTVWLPDGHPDGGWVWELSPGSEHYRTLPKASTVDELVRAVATSVLDEGPKR